MTPTKSANDKTRERITISLTPELLSLIDHKVDGVALRNRSHAIETILSQSFGLAPIEQAVFLVGGQKANQMHAVLIKGLQAVRQFGMKKVAIISGYFGREMVETLTAEEVAGLEVQFGYAESGDAGAVRDAKNLIGPGHFLACNTSTWPAIDLLDFITFHQTNHTVATVTYTNKESGQGLYMFAPDIFRYIPRGGFEMFVSDVFPSLHEQHLLSEYQPNI